MPCQTDPIPPDELAIEAFRLKKLVIEINTGKKPNPDHWDVEGNIDTKRMKERTVFLCKTLRATPPAKIKKYSLELQLWWREHQKHDHDRLMGLKDQADRAAQEYADAYRKNMEAERAYRIEARGQKKGKYHATKR